MTATIVSPQEKDFTKFALALRQLAEGRSNAVGTFTMTANAASTTVTAPNCGNGSHISITPKTASAATEYGAGTWYVSTVSNGSFVVTHVNSATADRTFSWVAIG